MQHQRDKQHSASTSFLYNLRPQLRLILVALSLSMFLTIVMENVVYGEPLVGSSGANVHKFHPNGRYGRRSLQQGAGESPSAHSEFGQERSSRTARDGSLKQLLMARNINFGDEDDATGRRTANNLNGLINDMELGNFQQELSKLLKCDYAGIGNLYYCDL